MSHQSIVEEYLSENLRVFPVIDFDKSCDKLAVLNLTASNPAINPVVLSDTTLFSNWITSQISQQGARYGIGGYNEHRIIYSRSSHFNAEDEPRCLHLGTDIWAPDGSSIYSPLDARVHSFHFNNHFGDYGPTIILEHYLKESSFYSLYGHLSLSSFDGLFKGKVFSAGQKLATLGNPSENGNWPPHLHFQLILDLEGNEGDYPGVCKPSEKQKYLNNCPDPQRILQYTFE